jgi:Ribonucleotide reductase, barrel domain
VIAAAQNESSKNRYPQNSLQPWDELRLRIREYGMRNSNCLAIAPTATISNIRRIRFESKRACRRHGAFGKKDENTLRSCPCRVGNQLCFSDLRPTERHGRSKNGEWSVTLQGKSGGPIQLKGYWSAISVREGDAWKIRMETINVTPPPAANPSATTSQ